jgi:hypothetical protein
LVEYARDTYGNTASQILDVFIDSVVDGMEYTCEPESKPSSYNTLGLAVAAKGIDMPVDGNSFNPLNDYLSMMSQSHFPLLRAATELGGNRYIIALSKATQCMCKRLVENMVISKFGKIACRIWRLLLEKQKLDEKQVYFG